MKHGGESMTTATFDTLSYFEKLKNVGVPEEQAKVQVETMHSLVKSYDEAARKELATKGDVQDLKVVLRSEMQDIRSEMQDIRSELKNDIQESKHEVLKWIMAMFLAQTAMLIAVIAFIK